MYLQPNNSQPAGKLSTDIKIKVNFGSGLQPNSATGGDPTQRQQIFGSGLVQQPVVVAHPQNPWTGVNQQPAPARTNPSNLSQPRPPTECRYGDQCRNINTCTYNHLSRPILLNVSCDHCGASNIIGTRFHCRECNIDLCEACAIGFQHRHIMEKITQPTHVPVPKKKEEEKKAPPNHPPSEEHTNRMATVVTANDKFQKLQLIVGLTEFVEIRVNNTSRQKWNPGCYLRPVEKRQDGQDFEIEALHNLPPLPENSSGKFTIPIRVFENARASNDWHEVAMSFFDKNGRPFGKIFTIKFQIVPACYQYLGELDIEIYKLALKLREQGLGRSFDDCFQHAKQACGEAITALSQNQRNPN